jgi:2'-5' RNA ligase
VTQSVELMLDPATDDEIRAQWDRLGEAGLPTSRRAEPSPSHAPHVTLWAGEAIEPVDDDALPRLFAGLDLELAVGGLLLFGPRRNGYVLVRPVTPSVALLELQQRVAQAIGSPAHPGFAAGRWTPHVTLARRVGAEQVNASLQALADGSSELVARVRQARRWDSDRKLTWPLVSR